MTNAPEIAVTTGTATDAQNRFARDALRSQRRRLLDMFAGFSAETWAAPTRCSEWSVHEVVRHLCDVTIRWTALLQGASPEEAGVAGIDPRTTPVKWLEQSAADRPAETLAVFEQASAELVAEVDRRTESGAADEMSFAYGPIPWSALVLHLFWDAWVHERDITVPHRRPHESPEIESKAAAAYGLVMAGVPSMLLGWPLEETVVLDGVGGGVFHLDVRDGAVTATAGGGQDAPGALRGELVDVVDSLIGRDPEPTEALRGPAERVEPLGTLRRFVLTPAG